MEMIRVFELHRPGDSIIKTVKKLSARHPEISIPASEDDLERLTLEVEELYRAIDDATGSAHVVLTDRQLVTLHTLPPSL